jgi:hypothetical protein
MIVQRAARAWNVEEKGNHLVNGAVKPAWNCDTVYAISVEKNIYLHAIEAVTEAFSLLRGNVAIAAHQDKFLVIKDAILLSA